MNTEPVDFNPSQRGHVAAAAGPLPYDPGDLAEAFGKAEAVLAEIARRVEPDWSAAEATFREMNRLQSLEARIVERLAETPAASLEEVERKLALWVEIRGGDEPEAEDVLVTSALRDLRRCRA